MLEISTLKMSFIETNWQSIFLLHLSILRTDTSFTMRLFVITRLSTYFITLSFEAWDIFLFFSLSVWGQCSHVFHMHCILKWLNSQQVQQQCPMCRQEWKFKEWKVKEHQAWHFIFGHVERARPVFFTLQRALALEQLKVNGALLKGTKAKTRGNGAHGLHGLSVIRGLDHSHDQTLRRL